MSSVLGSAGSGAATGAAFGPWGAVIGGAAGLLGGLIGGKDAKADQRKIDEEKARALGQSNRFTDYAYDRLGTTDQRGDSAYNEGYGAYSNLLDPRFADSFFGGGGGEGGSGGGGGGGGGGAAPVDPYGGMFGSSEDLAGRYRDFKGIDPEAMKYYREYANTGGWSDARRADAMAEGTAGVPALYGSLMNDINRRGAVTGSGLVDSSVARLAREQARATSDAARSSRLGIESAVDTGRQWGATGIEGHNTNDANARLQAMGGEGSVLASILGNKVSMRNTDEQVSASRAASGSANALAQAQMRANLYLAGAGGIQNYWQGDNANSSDLRGNILNNNQMTNQQMNSLLGTSINAPSTAQGVMGGMAQGGAFAAPWMSMFGNGQQDSTTPYSGSGFSVNPGGYATSMLQPQRRY